MKSDKRLYNPTYQDIHDACIGIAKQIKLYGIEFDAILGITRGGLVPANTLSHLLNVPLIPISYSSKKGQGDNKNHDNVVPSMVQKTLLIFDDIADSGLTLKDLHSYYSDYNAVYTGCIYYKKRPNPNIVTNFSWVTVPEDAPWVVFPWEQAEL